MPPPIAPSEVHIGSDIRNTMRALLATHEATRRMMPETREMLAYNNGFREALLLMAEALNISLAISAAHHYMER